MDETTVKSPYYYMLRDSLWWLRVGWLRKVYACLRQGYFSVLSCVLFVNPNFQVHFCQPSPSQHGNSPMRETARFPVRTNSSFLSQEEGSMDGFNRYRLSDNYNRIAPSDCYPRVGHWFLLCCLWRLRFVCWIMCGLCALITCVCCWIMCGLCAEIHAAQMSRGHAAKMSSANMSALYMWDLNPPTFLLAPFARILVPEILNPPNPCSLCGMFVHRISSYYYYARVASRSSSGIILILIIIIIIIISSSSSSQCSSTPTGHASELEPGIIQV